MCARRNRRVSRWIRHDSQCWKLLCIIANITIAFGCPSLLAQEQPKTVVVAETPPQPSLTSAERQVSWKTLPRNLLQDQKDIWLSPVHLAKGQHLLPALAITGVTGALIAADAQDTPYFRRTQRFEGYNDIFSGRNTSIAMAVVPASFLVVGHFRHDSYAEKTALLAGEAYADSAILGFAMKTATRRLRPSDIAPNGNFSDTFFNSSKPLSGVHTSFPSGHAAAAFSIATVFAHRYRRHRWVPWVAYGAAGAIGFSRVTTQAHFPSDVFLGAALGFTITEFSVLRPR